MSVIEEIMHEYIRMREYGLEVKEALQTLKIYIDPLDLRTRELLAQHLRAYESGNRLKPQPEPYQKQPQMGTTGIIWIQCINCGKKNRTKEIFCYACSELLHPIDGLYDTKHFTQATDDLFDKAYFGQDSILILETKNTNGHFEARPQTANREITVGRGDSQNSRIDLNLNTVESIALGVSRMHASIKFDAGDEMLYIRDRGSANGTYLNGQKLFPGDKHLLRHGDELRMGNMELIIRYLHPGEEL